MWQKPISRRQFMFTIANATLIAPVLRRFTAAGEAKHSLEEVIAKMIYQSGPFEPSWESLKNYECPEWFRDAKFGIWTHWSPQQVPEQGDWYARNMYIQGHRHYNYHVQHYGHPSKFGYKDICRLWTLEKWDPEGLMDLFVRAGAKYFVALANHHCNFDCWDSTYHEWNSVRVGPKRDVVGTWAKVARERGLRFGASVHTARAWWWFEVAHGSDKEGPMAGVPYDGNLTKEDGKGQWWEGLDPQKLYCRTHKPGEPPDDEYLLNFFLRVKDLIDKYRLDLLYFDDGILPLNNISPQIGLRIAAHLYNSSILWHGRCEAVMTTKGLPSELRKALVWDIERGRAEQIEPYPWQIDTSIGDWHYRRNDHYKSPEQIIHTLIDVVSKNGNMLLNVPGKGDGTIDDEVVRILEAIGGWLKVNGEAIYGTRPWLKFGEDPNMHVTEDIGAVKFTANDFRFTTKGKTLYAIALGWAEGGKWLIGSLASIWDGNKIESVQLLGYDGKLKWQQTNEGLLVEAPPQKPCECAFVLKIEGQNLKPAR